MRSSDLCTCNCHQRGQVQAQVVPVLAHRVGLRAGEAGQVLLGDVHQRGSGHAPGQQGLRGSRRVVAGGLQDGLPLLGLLQARHGLGSLRPEVEPHHPVAGDDAGAVAPRLDARHD